MCYLKIILNGSSKENKATTRQNVLLNVSALMWTWSQRPRQLTNSRPVKHLLVTGVTNSISLANLSVSHVLSEMSLPLSESHN